MIPTTKMMIVDGQLVIDRIPVPLVLMEVIACKCSRVCKVPECQ